MNHNIFYDPEIKVPKVNELILFVVECGSLDFSGIFDGINVQANILGVNTYFPYDKIFVWKSI